MSRPFAVFALCALAFFPAARALSQTPATGGKEEREASFKDLQDSKTLLSKWMQTQQILSGELADWRIAKDVIRDRIDLTKSEIESIQTKTATADEEIAKADSDKKETVKKREELLAAIAAVKGALPVLETEVRGLHEVLPPHFQEKIAPIFQRIPPDPETTKISLAERFQNVIGILNEINKFNSEVSVVNEIRLLADGKPTEVQTIYLGLGGAYYIATNGEAAGVGKPGQKGWEWTPSNDLAKPLNEALAIMASKTKPKFVSIPAQVD